MKKIITLTALIVGLGTSVFAATPAKSKAAAAHSEITFASLASQNGFTVKVSSAEAAKSYIAIYDSNKDVVFKHLLSKETYGEKDYNVAGLEVGDYTVVVTSNQDVVKKQLHIYDEDGRKAFIFLQ